MNRHPTVGYTLRAASSVTVIRNVRDKLMKILSSIAILALLAGCAPSGGNRIDITRDKIKNSDIVILCSIDNQPEGQRYRVDEIWKGNLIAQPILTNGFLIWKYSPLDTKHKPTAVLLIMNTGGGSANPTSMPDAEFQCFYDAPELGEDMNVSVLNKIRENTDIEQPAADDRREAAPQPDPCR
jgi:hypothetical protein